MTLAEIITKLEKSVAAKNDPSYATTHAFHDGDAVTADELDAHEKTLKTTYPPSYRKAVLEHGLFSLGKPGAQHDHLVFHSWPVEDHRTALAHYRRAARLRRHGGGRRRCDRRR